MKIEAANLGSADRREVERDNAKREMNENRPNDRDERERKGLARREEGEADERDREGPQTERVRDFHHAVTLNNDVVWIGTETGK